MTDLLLVMDECLRILSVHWYAWHIGFCKKAWTFSKHSWTPSSFVDGKSPCSVLKHQPAFGTN